MILGRVILAPPERTELKRRARSRSLAVEAVRRAKVILMLAGGGSYSEICERLGCTDRYINLWKERFQQDDLRNYVVDLAQQKILGETGCQYFSTDPGPRPGRISCEVKWSPDSTKFVQEWEQKIYIDCVAGAVAPGPNLMGVVNLGKQIDKATSDLVKKREPAGVWVEIDQVNNDGGIVIKPEVVSRAEGHEWETLFTLSENLRLHKTPSGLRVERVSVRKLPNDQ